MIAKLFKLAREPWSHICTRKIQNMMHIKCFKTLELKIGVSMIFSNSFKCRTCDNVSYDCFIDILMVGREKNQKIN
jgi:hypothetical protein